jgi:putative transposase
MAGIPVHLIQRGNNRHACFFADEDYSLYLHHLQELAVKFGCAVHAYVLMTNHVHWLVTPQSASGISLLMKHLGQRYVQYINRTYRRSGTLWEGRFRSCLVQSEEYLLSCHRYIEVNPVRTNMVSYPSEYRWSSYRTNGEGRPSTLITPHGMYERLAKNERERLMAYQSLFSTELDPQIVTTIRSATNGNYALGDSRFVQQVQAHLGRRVERGKAGRPLKERIEKDVRQGELI